MLVALSRFSRGLLLICQRFTMECLSSFDIILCQMWLGVPLAMFLWILPLEQDKLAKSKLVKNVYLQPLVQMRIVVKNLPANNSGDVRDTGLIPGSRRAPGGRHGNPLQCRCLQKSLDRAAWQATVCGVTKSWTWLRTCTQVQSFIQALITHVTSEWFCDNSVNVSAFKLILLFKNF